MLLRAIAQRAGAAPTRVLAAAAPSVRRLSAAHAAPAGGSEPIVPGVPGSPARRQALEDAFRRVVDARLPASGRGAVFATAWLASDNVLVALLARFYPELLAGMGLLAVDTLHLFPETLEVAAAVQDKYGKRAAVFRPARAATRAEFVAAHGDCEAMNHADFDLASKVEPYTRGLAALGRDVLITGRRGDQGEKRITLAEWEEQPRTLNPLAQWRWADVTGYVDAHDVPVNPAHSYVFRSAAPIAATERHRAGLPWERVDLFQPFWRASEAELRGSPPAPHIYVFKSFGDMHTSVPVEPHESERAGRFVRTANTECGIHTRAARPGAPHGGRLVDRAAPDAASAAAALARCTRTLELTERQVCDVELLANGAFSPLEGFMTEAEYASVLAHSRLPEQQLFGMPVTLDVPADAGFAVGDAVALRYKGAPVAVLDVASAWAPDRVAEAAAVFGTTSLEHPGVADLAMRRGALYLGGPIIGLAQPARAFPCASPREVRAALPRGGGGAPIVAFQCRNPIHRAHYELVRRALEDLPGAIVLIHPTVGPTQPGDIDGATRVATYRALEAELAEPRIRWAYLPLNMRMAGPREALHHMIVRKNFGCTHFIVGRDMAGTKSTLTGEDFYKPFAAQEAAAGYAAELAMETVAYENVVYTDKGFFPESEAIVQGLHKKNLSGTEFRRRLRAGEDIPAWFAFKSVIDVLRKGGDADSIVAAAAPSART